MAGALTISTLNNDTGVLATQNGMTGIAKAWVNFNQAGTINGSFNISSIVKNSAGDYSISFTTAMPNANYSAVFGTCGLSANVGGKMMIESQTSGTLARTASSIRVLSSYSFTNPGGGTDDGSFTQSVAIFSS